MNRVSVSTVDLRFPPVNEAKSCRGELAMWRAECLLSRMVVSFVLVTAAALPTRAQPCPSFTKAVRVGKVASRDVTEASGMVASRKNRGVLWVHNDSGDSARVFAMATDGTPIRTYSLVGASAKDWEDMALGRGPDLGTDYLYLGDIGDNRRVRQFVTVYRVREPHVEVKRGEKAIDLTGVVALEMAYPDRPHNAEALLSDPVTGDLFVVTKSDSGVSQVFRYPFPHADGVRVTLQEVATVKFIGDAQLDRLVTAGDITPLGDQIILRTYNRAWVWKRKSGTSVGEALMGSPCQAPVAGFPRESQGESVAFGPDGRSYFTVSEGSFPPIYRYTR